MSAQVEARVGRGKFQSRKFARKRWNAGGSRSLELADEVVESAATYASN